MSIRNIIIPIIIALATCHLRAEEPQRVLSRWETGVRSGYAFNSNRVLMDRMVYDGTISHCALSWHLRYSFTRPDAGRTASVYQGVGLSANTFFQQKNVGSPIGLYVFQGAPIITLTDRLSLDYEWNFGATFGWKKTGRNQYIRSNLVVGSSVNAYLNLGVKFNYLLTNSLNLTGGLDLTHYSNGNTSWPNPGVNTAGAAIGLVYTPGGGPIKVHSPFSTDVDFKRGISYDIMGYGAWRTAYFPAEDGAFTEEGQKALLPGHFGVAGINFSPMLDLFPTFRTGLSLDLQWSENTGLNDYLVPGTSGENAKFYHPPFFRQVSGGLSARAELVMPIFSLNVGIGYGIVGPHETRKLYQTVNLKTYLTGPLYFNVGYRLYNFRSPSNLMLGFGVTLGRKKSDK